jgi:hemolysin activation/secretion protein
MVERSDVTSLSRMLTCWLTLASFCSVAMTCFSLATSSICQEQQQQQQQQHHRRERKEKGDSKQEVSTKKDKM